MATLPALDRARVAAQWMRVQLESCAFTKADLRAAVDATDAWIEANQAAFNAALPVTFRTGSSLTQKTLVFCYVAMRRAGILRTEEDG